jgi:stringent starvation protein B
MEAVIAIYARENGQGMMFAQDGPPPPPIDDSDNDPPPRSHLKVVK